MLAFPRGDDGEGIEERMGLRCAVWLHHLQLATCNLLLVENVELYLAGSQIFAVFAPNDRIYEETTMYYCAGIGYPDPLGWYRDKPEDNAFMRLVVLSPNLFTSSLWIMVL